MILPNGEIRHFKVSIKSVVREVLTHPDFDDEFSKVEITGIVFEWNGYELFPCVDTYTVPDYKVMEVIGNIFDNPQLLCEAGQQRTVYEGIWKELYMSENKHELWELKQMQSLPLSAKIQMTRQRIRAWIDEFGEDGVYVSFSGGKDSTVLLDIIRKDYPNIEAVFVDTGLEYPSVRHFAINTENVTELRPTMNFRDVIIKHGYPIISKEVSQVVQEARIGLKRGDGSYQFRIERILGIGHYKPSEDGIKSQFDVSRYQFLLDAPFEISDKCCKVMKKKPARNYEKRTKKKVILAAMAEESRLRRQRWLKYGCNAWDDKKRQSSNPMSFWTEQDVLRYIHENSLDIANAYGKVVVKNDGIDGQMNIHDYLGDYRDCQFETTGCKRTGCIFCGFGITQDKQRFTRLSLQEAQLCDYVMRGGEFSKDGMWQPSQDGLGYWFVLKWLNIHGNLGIGIPNEEYYLSTYQSEKTNKFLEVKELLC